MIQSALVIDEPWISKILSGEKTWEMRSTRSNIRGPIGLIRKGSGTIIGVARQVACRGPLNRSEMLSNGDRHQIPVAMINSGAVDKWCYAWELTDATVLTQPVVYDHPPGAVIWVTLTEKVRREVHAQLDGQSSYSEPADTDPISCDAGSVRGAGGDSINNDQAAQVSRDDKNVPYANDGTCFGRHLEKAGGFTVGAKGNEVKYRTYEQAVDALRKMPTAKWRRPNLHGNWGIVVAKKWARSKD